MVKIIDDPTPFTIDVLRMELEQKLPYWLSPEGKGLREDAMAANHTGAAVAGFNPLLMKRKKRFFKRKPITEADVEALPASGGVGETDMNSVVPKRKKFRIRHGKSLKETYNPNEPREPKGANYGRGGRWTKRAGVEQPWRPDPDPTFVEFPPIKMEEEDQTISKETIEKLRLTEDDLKARRRVLTQGNENKAEHLIAFDDVGWENYTSDNLTHVSLPDTLVETLRNSVARYTMVHNHPWDSSLSGADLNIAAFPGVKRMFAHVATGSIYSAEQTQLLRDVIKYSPTKYQKLWDAMGISARTINEILSPFNPGFNLEMLGVASEKDEAGWLDNVAKLRKYWWRIASHLNCLLLNDAGVFKYTYHLDPKLEAFYDPLIKKARESKDWKIASNFIYHEMLEEVNKHKPDNDPFDNLKLYKHTINDES